MPLLAFRRGVSVLYVRTRCRVLCTRSGCTRVTHPLPGTTHPQWVHECDAPTPGALHQPFEQVIRFELLSYVVNCQ